MSAAAFLPAPPRPPHDPLWLSLGARTGWRLAAGASPQPETDSDGALVLPAEPGTGRVLGEAAGSLGGLVLPGTMALDAGGNLWVIDRERRRLRRFDDCAVPCRFRDVPCGGPALADPRAIVADRGRLYLADAGPPGRLLVLDARALALLAVWAPPAEAAPQPWQPTAVAVRGDTVLVADAANGAIHRFAPWGGWRGAWRGIGAVSRLAVDCDGRIYVVVPGLDAVQVRDAEGRLVGQPVAPGEVADRFPPAPFPVSREGAVDLARRCAGAGWFDLSGRPLARAPETAPVLAITATAATVALDSRIARCEWHRVVLRADRPPRTAIALATTTAETELPDSVVAGLPETAWASVPLGPAAAEALVLSPPGRFLWARITLRGDGAASPRLTGLDVEYPRISLTRYLPAAFGGGLAASGFLDRLLAIFDRGLRDIEDRIDDQAALFDPHSTPSAPGPDMLGWLASWIGVVLDRRWPEARRRRLVAAASTLFACRGTVRGLRGALLLWLGWDRLEGLVQRAAACAPACAEPPPSPPLPLLVLEHFKLRRWLFLGAGRIGDAAELWGAGILGRSQLGVTARTGATRLDATRDPLRDPFHRDAHRLSLFLPAHALASAPARGALARLVAEHVPAHVEARVVPVHPRMRVGIQASLGFDSVVGCWPPSLASDGFALGAVRLGRASVLPGAGGPGGLPPRLGRDSRLRPASHPSDPTGEVMS